MRRRTARRVSPRWLVGLAAVLMAATLPAAEPRPATFKTAGGVEMNYLTIGDSGSWVVLIPGLSDNPQRMYFDSGIAPALAENHRVVAVPDPGKMSGPNDVIELVDSLKIDKAHIYGYSMGGGFTGSLLALHPERFITAGFGGSGIWEFDQKEHDRAAQLDQGLLKAAGLEGRRGPGGAAGPGAGPRGGRGPGAIAPTGGATSAAGQAKPAEGLHAPVAAARPHSRTPIDLTKVTIPILAINGTFDQPFEKTERMFRELRDFQNVFLQGHDHMSAIGVQGTFPKEHVEAIVRFINANDPNP